MASKTMREIAAKHEAELKRLEQSTDTDETTEPNPTDPDEDSYDNTDDVESDVSDDASQYETDSDNDDDSQDDDGGDTGNNPDYENKFNRLRKKQSKIEKEKAELAKKVQLLEENLELAKQYQASNAAPNESQQTTSINHSDAVSEHDIDAYLEENLGDDWSYMDESSKRSFRFLAKQTLEKMPDQSKIDEIVSSKLQEQNKRKQLGQFTKDLDNFVQGIDPDTDFHEVVNEAGFDDYLRSNRVAKAMFIEASQNIDDDSKQMMQDVLAGYLGKSSLEPKLTTKTTTPDVKTKAKPRRSQKKVAITAEQIDKAIRDSKIPSKRKAAQKILFKAQELGLI